MTSSRPSPSSPSSTPITIDARRLVTGLVAVAVVLTVLSLVTDAIVLARGPGGLATQRLIEFVDLDAEANLPAFYATLLLLVASGLLGLIASNRRAAGAAGASHWALLAVLFLGLAIDEAVGFHETMIGPFRRLLPGVRLAYFGWVVPGAVFVVAVGALFARFLLSLDRRRRNQFVAAGVVFVGGALGLELVEGYIASDAGEDNWPYVIALTAQELLEMLGAILFIHALLEHLATVTSAIDLHWVGRPPGAGGGAGGGDPLRPGSEPARARGTRPG